MMDTQEALKKYWPWALGAVVGLWLVTRYMGGSSSASSGSSYASLLAAQQAASVQNAQLGLQQQQVQASIDAQAAQTQLARDTLTANTNIAYLNAQGATAQAIGTAATGVVNALFQPINTAMAAAATENSAAFQSAAVVAAQGFAAQAGMVNSSAASVASVANGLQVWGPVSQAVATANANNAANTPFNTLVKTGGSVAKSYFSGGMSNFAGQ